MHTDSARRPLPPRSLRSLRHPLAASPVKTLALLLLAGAATGCADQGDNVLVTVTADEALTQFKFVVRDDLSSTLLEPPSWQDASKGVVMGKEQLIVGVRLPRRPPGATGPRSYSLFMFGIKGELDVDAGVPAAGSTRYFWATTGKFDGTHDITAHLRVVPDTFDTDNDFFPDASTWPMQVADPAALAKETPSTLLDCNDKDGSINPLAPDEKCGDAVDRNCDGVITTACLDTDNDGDPDTTDCDKTNPKIHHPITDPKSPHYDPFPQSANCCGYSLGVAMDPARHMTVADPRLCHADTCGNGIIEDCSGADVPCLLDNDCDEFVANETQPATCKVKTTPSVKDQDCNDCDPGIHPKARELCGDGIDNNCNGLIDEGCTPCDLDGDGYQRASRGAGDSCPDATNPPNKPTDCNDYDANVFPDATSPSQHGVSIKAWINNHQQFCDGKEGGTIACALRRYCQVSPLKPGVNGAAPTPSAKARPLDENCNGTKDEGCPDRYCDNDGDGFIDVMKANDPKCQGQGMATDCDDTNAEIFLNAPEKCGDHVAQNCLQDVACGATYGMGMRRQDLDKDGWEDDFDCDDNNASVHPWATELCDDLDNDCDGLVDEGNPDPDGNPMWSETTGAVTDCTDSDVGECGKTRGLCVCSRAAIDTLHFDQTKRAACAAETKDVDQGAKAADRSPRCYFAGQPQLQSCNPMDRKDDDCDGRVDAPDGKSVNILGQPNAKIADYGANCWPAATGECKAGTVVGCDMSKPNCFAAMNLPGVNPAYVCDAATAVCPVAEKCNGRDDDCNGALPVAEQDVDKDHYLACGSSDNAYMLAPEPCEMNNLAPGIKGCGDCADSVGKTTNLAGVPIDNRFINPEAPDVCDGIDNDCSTKTPDGTGDCAGPAPAMICCQPNNMSMPPNGVGCKDPTGDVYNCGGCAMVCSSNHISARACGASLCTGNCDTGYADCNGDKLRDGCETHAASDADNCGGGGGTGQGMVAGCGVKCSSTNMATRTCGAGLCTGTCAAGYADCNGDKLSDGCETSSWSVTNCGPGGATNNGQGAAAGCGNVCSTQNGAPGCAAGTCTISCAAGYGNCDTVVGNMGVNSNGCEVNTATDVNNCGAGGANNAGCGVRCSGNNVPARGCTNGVCDGACAPGYADCNGNKQSDGCEDNVAGDANNCGAGGGVGQGMAAGCGVKCSSSHVPSPTCGGGVCNGACAAGYADCNGNKQMDGCEDNVAADPDNCGAGGGVGQGMAAGCGVACSGNNVPTRVCSGGACSGVCAAGYADCNANRQADGCEVSTFSVTNCGPGGAAGGGLGKAAGCGNVCSTQNGAPSCAAGSCTIVCNAGYGNCDGTVGNMGVGSNGCEASTLTDPNNCGAGGANNAGCGVKCSGNHMATVTCGGGVCNGQCAPGYADCDGDKLGNGCETPTYAVGNCGGGGAGNMGCGSVCSTMNGVPACAAGACTISCNAGYGNCDGVVGNMGAATNGCEVNTAGDPNNCGVGGANNAGCGVKCSGVNIPTPTCAGGACNGTCANGYADCDGNKQANGCEVQTNTITNCGPGGATNNGRGIAAGCASVCSTQNGTAACTGGACAITCNAGYANCNGVVANGGTNSDGCEVSTYSVTNCGPGGVAGGGMGMAAGCGNVCSTQNGTPSCAAGTCTIACNPGYTDCDGVVGNTGPASNGCEVHTAADPMNCGGCGTKCSANNVPTPTCAGGACNGTCANFFADCNGNKQSDGCETSTMSDANNCGAGGATNAGCGAKCSSTHITTPTCGGGICNGTCDPGYADCNMNKLVDGCEADLTANTSCGACGVMCNAATQQCSSGMCRAKQGQPCAKSADCLSNNCQPSQGGALCAMGGVSCTLQCQVVDPTGTMCVAATGGTDPKKDCQVANPAMCVATGCAGGGLTQCAASGNSVSCGAASCANTGGGIQATSAASTTHKCGGTINMCPTQGPTPCAAGYGCDAMGTACVGACASDLDCVAGYYCDGTMRCAARLASGPLSACTRSFQCQSDLCSGGKCVDCASSVDCSPASAACIGSSCAVCTGLMDCSSAKLGNACVGGACTCSVKADCSNVRVDTCDGNSVCVCGATGGPCAVGQKCSSGKCLQDSGQLCRVAADCASGGCTTHSCN